MTVAEQVPYEMWDKIKASVVSIRTTTGSGTGWVASPNGIIVTNVHVVGHDEAVVIEWVDKTQQHARVVYANTHLDIAFLVAPRVSAPPLTLADSRMAKPGQPVFAIGHPQGIKFSMSQGIISAVERNVVGVPMLQTDTTIIAGNSGGPLLTTAGTVVGVNTSGTSDTLAFAVPTFLFFDELRRFAQLSPQELSQTKPIFHCKACKGEYTPSDRSCENCGLGTSHGAGEGMSADKARSIRVVTEVLEQLGFCSRQHAAGDSTWRIPASDSTEVWVSLLDGGISFDAWIAELPDVGLEAIYRFLLTANDVDTGQCRVGVTSHLGIVCVGFYSSDEFIDASAVRDNLHYLLALCQSLSGILTNDFGCKPPRQRLSVEVLD